jgi:hypothetical protein
MYKFTMRRGGPIAGLTTEIQGFMFTDYYDQIANQSKILITMNKIELHANLQ